MYQGSKEGTKNRSRKREVLGASEDAGDTALSTPRDKTDDSVRAMQTY